MIYFLIQAQIPLVLEYSKVFMCINITLYNTMSRLNPTMTAKGQLSLGLPDDLSLQCHWNVGCFIFLFV